MHERALEAHGRVPVPPQRPRRTRQQNSAKTRDLMLTGSCSPHACVLAAQTPAPVVFSTYEAVDGRLMPAASLRRGIQAPDSRAGPAKGSGQTESGARDHFRQGGSRRRGPILFLAVSWGDCAVSAGFCPPGSGRKGRRQPAASPFLK